MTEQPPTGKKRTLTPRRPRNADVRQREYLTDREVEQLVAAARKRESRHGHRDATLITTTYLHGLRASETCALRWDQIDFAQGLLHVVRRKGSKPAVHTLRGSELRALRRLQREQTPPSPFVFTTERRTPLTTHAFRKTLTRISDAAGMPFPVHPHMLRHACGYELQRAGLPTRVIQAWMGHSDIRHTVRYTELSEVPFRDVWRGKD
jgi:integrase